MAVDTEIWSIPLFASFEPQVLQGLLSDATPRRLSPGETLFRRGEEAEGGFLLTHGEIALESRDSNGKQDKILRPVALLGEVALIAPITRPATAIARESATLLYISRTLFCDTLEAHPLTAGKVRALFKDRLAQFSSRLQFADRE